jgi:hypothetical protein
MLLIVTALWMAWIRLGRMGPSVARWCIVGVLSALAILCKPNACGVALAGLTIFFFQFHTAWRGRKVRQFLMQPIVGLVAALIVLAPWCIWNWRQHRSLFGLEIHRDWWDAHTAEAGVRQGHLTLENADAFVSGTWESFWGCFGYATTRLPDLNYQIVTLLCGLAAGGLLCRMEDSRVRNGWPNHRSRIAVWGALLFGAMIVWSSHAWHSANHGMAAQGRYILPIALPCLALLAVGVLLLAKSGRDWIPAGLLFGLLAWLQYSAVAAEQQSNRLPQLDRRVRARLLALVSDVPGTRLAVPAGSIELVGDGAMSISPHAASIRAEPRTFVRCSQPMAAEGLSAVEIEQRWFGGVPANGELRLRAADGSGEILASIPYRDALLGAASYRFDLRRITRDLADRDVMVEISPSSEPCHVEWYRFQILDRNGQPMRDVRK